MTGLTAAAAHCHQASARLLINHTTPSTLVNTTITKCCLLLWLAFAAAELPPCNPGWADGEFILPYDCVWSEQTAVPSKRVVIQAPRSVGNLPALNLENVEPGPPGDFSLTLKRMVLRKMTLAPPTGAGGLPRLLPLGIFAAVPRSLSLYDVRMVVEEKEFQEYLGFFRQQLRTSRDATAAGPTMHTDNSSVLNVPYWSDNTTEVFSLTLLSGPCNIKDADTSPWKGSLIHFPTIPGCGMRSADNKTLIQTLLRDAANATTQPLMIRIVANVTLGPGILQSIPIRRPITFLGLVSAPTSIDMGMVVNQLNVTLPYGKITWQSLVLENLAPGDAVSSTVAPPFSTTVSSNVWAMYCNRSASSCLNANNVTLVVPSQEELNYQVFMYTMFNSPAPALRDLTDFYRTDLSTQVVQFVAGPGNDSLTVIRLLNKGWDFWYVITTLRPFAAPIRPMPRQAMVMQRYRAGALVYALQDCTGFATALSSKSTSTRTRVWTLINNISIADGGQMQCSWPDGNVTYPTQLLGPVVHTYGPSARVHDSGSVASPLSPEAIVLGHADATSNRNGSAGADPYLPYDVAGLQDRGSVRPPYQDLYALSFGYVPSLFQLPVDAHDKFLQIQNLTLKDLPQMAPTRNLRGMRRLLQADTSPIGIWTVLLWPIRRTMYGVPVTIADSQLLIPQPEWDVLANEARQAPSFAMQLQGQAGGLTFTGVSLLDNNTMRVGAFQGPGVAGTNLWLLPDPAAAKVPGYSWPSELFDTPHGSSSSSSNGHSSTALKAGIGAAAAVLGLLALALLALLLRKRKRRSSSAALEGKVALNGASVGVLELQDSDEKGGKGQYEGGSVQVNYDKSADTDKVHDSLHGRFPKSAAAAIVAAGGAAAAGAAGVASSRASSQRQPSEGGVSRRSSSSTGTPTAKQCDSGCGALDNCKGHRQGIEAEQPRLSLDKSPSTVEQTIAQGLERWNAAVSQTALQLMQRRLQSNIAMFGHTSSTGGSSSVTGSVAGSQQRPKQQHLPTGSPAVSPTPSTAAPAAGGGMSGGEAEQGLQLQSMIGTGSFGSVYLGSWRGKRVAVKVMHLQGNTLLDATRHSQDFEGVGSSQKERLQRQRAQNSPPHMAVMEAVVSSTMSHPNVVQVFTYMLSPLMVQPGVDAANSVAVTAQTPEQQQEAAAKGEHTALFGYQLRLVMEYCDKGTLREALDKRRLPRLSGTSFPDPSVVFSLSHDIAAAMLHLHSEGIIHGDLKAGNVLLTANPTPGSSNSCTDQFARSMEIWAAAGSQPLSAKVADFGMAMPLGPKDTHATMLARGTPTHMSPELFMAGHVSKASDCYAYGILLYEIITGMRAYAGVPIPLLPHEVAMQGLRPKWPDNMPPECDKLRALAEACWQHRPQDRPAFDKIMQILEDACTLPQQPSQQQQLLLQDPLKAAQQGDNTAQEQAGQGGDVLYSPMGAPERKPSREQMDWSEISYGGSKHDGGWS